MEHMKDKWALTAKSRTFKLTVMNSDGRVCRRSIRRDPFDIHSLNGWAPLEINTEFTRSWVSLHNNILDEISNALLVLDNVETKRLSEILHIVDLLQ